MSRPKFWFYLAGPVIVGISYGATDASEFITMETLVFFLYFLIPANIYLYGINDMFDREIDKGNPKKSDEGPEVIYRDNKRVKISIVSSGLLSLILFLYVSIVPMLFVILFAVLGFLYSAGLRFKTTPFADSVSNGMYILPGLAIYTDLAGGLPPLTIIAGAWIWSMSMHTFSAIPDIESDKNGGIKTTATYLEKNNTIIYCGVLWLLSSILFLLNHIFFAILLVYPAILIYISNQNIDISKAYWWYPYINMIVGTILSLGGIYSTMYEIPL